MKRLNGSDALMLYVDSGSAYNHTRGGRPRQPRYRPIKRAPNGKPDYAWARDAVFSEVERASSPV